MNVKKGIIALLIFPLFIISMMPLSVHADDYDNDTIVGFNVELDEANAFYNQSQNNTNSLFVYKAIFELNDYYVGSINLTLNVNTGTTYTFTRNVTVNGNSFEITFYINTSGTQASTERPSLYNVTYTVNSHNLNIMPNGMQVWDFPMESYGFVYGTLIYQNPIDIYTNSYNMNYPVFAPKLNEQITRVYMDKDVIYDMVFCCFSYYSDTFDTVYDFKDRYGDKQYQWISYDVVQTIYIPIDGVRHYTYLIKAKIKCNKTENYQMFSLVNGEAFIPIYFNYEGYPYLSTDFALRYGLSNSFLDNIQKIAAGTSESITSVSSADQQNDTFKDQADNLITQEEEFTSDMMLNLQQIDTSFSFNNFGNKFMTSAVWVRDQYDHMITNSPFGSLVTFSLLLGLGLLIIGRTVNK